MQFTCIGVWANQSRRCPLCNAPMSDCLLHDLGSAMPTKVGLRRLTMLTLQFFLPPLPERPFARRRVASPSPTRKDAWRAEQAAVARRRDVYARGLFAKHVASNGYTGFRANPSPRDITKDGATAERARLFLRRELRVWAPPDDVDGLVDHIVAFLRSVDVRSEASVRFLEPLVDETYPQAAEHLAHELYAFLRSPYAELAAYDEVVQYDLQPSRPFLEAQRGRLSSHSLSATSSGRSESRGRSHSSDDSSAYSRSPSRRRRSRSRDITRSDIFRPEPARGERRWDQADSWVDPEYAAEVGRRDKRRRRKEQRARARERKREAASAAALAVDHGLTLDPAIPAAGINIKGAAERRQSLLERLAIAKGHVSDIVSDASAETPPPATPPPDSEQRAKELRDKLIAERKRKALREQLLSRKKAKTGEEELSEEAVAVVP